MDFVFLTKKHASIDCRSNSFFGTCTRGSNGILDNQKLDNFERNIHQLTSLYLSVPHFWSPLVSLIHLHCITSSFFANLTLVDWLSHLLPSKPIKPKPSCLVSNHSHSVRRRHWITSTLALITAFHYLYLLLIFPPHFSFFHSSIISI